MSLLEIKNVDISYGKNLTVKNCSLNLEKEKSAVSSASPAAARPP